MRSRSSGATPMPVSDTVTQQLVILASGRAPTRPPSRLNFTALDSRLSTTCLKRSSSVSRRRRRGRHRARAGSSCAAARSRTSARHYSSASRTENVDGSSSIRPASTFDRSRMSLSSSSRCRPDAEDVAQVVLLPVVDVAEHALQQDLGEPDHGVERRPQLVRHAGEELRLVPARHLELAGLLLQLAEQPRVDDRQRRLAREGLQAARTMSWEKSPGGASHDQSADDHSLVQHRHREHRSPAGFLSCPRCGSSGAVSRSAATEAGPRAGPADQGAVQRDVGGAEPSSSSGVVP